MRRTIAVTAFTAFSSLLVGVAPQPDLQKRVDAVFADFAAPGVPGASVGIFVHGVPVLERAYGLADLEAGTPMTPRTNVYLASVSKQFTSMGIMRLAEAGKLTYDDSLDRFFPAWPAYGKGITLRQLLHHTSGLVDYFTLVPPGLTTTVTSQDVLTMMEQQSGTDFAPGSQYAYSNSGYVVLGQVIERASGQSYAAFLEDQIFRPLGMDHTVVYDRVDAAVPERAYGYDLDEAGHYARRDAVGDPLYTIYGDGGLYSSIEDLAKWDKALGEGRLISAATLAEATTPAKLTDGTTVPYGFAWQLDEDHGEPVMDHGGSYAGFRTAIRRYRQSGVTVVVLTNRRNAEAPALAKAVADAYFAE